jgi:hypothetical protein
MNNIKEHIKSNQKELDNPGLSPQRRRHVSQELESLERYQRNHPDSDKDPTALELYCDENPNALECRIHE